MFPTGLKWFQTFYAASFFVKKSLEYFQKVSMFGWTKTKIEKTRTKCYFDTLADLNSYSISSMKQKHRVKFASQIQIA